MSTDQDEEIWVSEEKAMQLLGIRSKTTLQRLRNEDKIRFSQPSRRIILYHKQSLYDYLDEHANR